MKIKVLGISLENMGLRESLRQTDKFLRNGALNTIAFVSTKKLVQASENPEQKEWMEKLDMVVFEDVDALHAAGITNHSRIKETEQGEYLTELLRKIKHNKNVTFLLTDTKEQLEQFEDELHGVISGIPIKGRACLEEYGENLEGMLNSMNALNPDVILSQLTYPEGIRLMNEYRMMLNGELWVTLPQHINNTKKRPLKNRILQHLYKRQLTKKVSSFQSDSDSV